MSLYQVHTGYCTDMFKTPYGRNYVPYISNRLSTDDLVPYGVSAAMHRKSTPLVAGREGVL